MTPPDEDNPFGGLEPDLKERIQERMPQKITPKKAMYATLGLAIMVLGGLVVVALGIMGLAGDRPGRGVFLGMLFAAPICSGGYWLWQQAQKRERRPPVETPPS